VEPIIFVNLVPKWRLKWNDISQGYGMAFAVSSNHPRNTGFVGAIVRRHNVCLATLYQEPSSSSRHGPVGRGHQAARTCCEQLRAQSGMSSLNASARHIGTTAEHRQPTRHTKVSKCNTEMKKLFSCHLRQFCCQSCALAVLSIEPPEPENDGSLAETRINLLE
jgi:hypothetical protein